MLVAVRSIAVLVAVAIALAGCGIKGPLETPQEAKADNTAKADSGQGKSEADAPKKHKEFILDPLLR